MTTIHLFPNKVLCTLDILYYRPHSLILQEFCWQVDDEIPNHPRIHKFLKFWYKEIDAVIRSATIIENYNNKIRHIDALKNIT